MGIRVEHNAPGLICDPHDDTGDDRSLEPELCLRRIAALDVAHHMVNAAVEIHLRLSVEIDVRAHPQNRR